MSVLSNIGKVEHDRALWSKGEHAQLGCYPLSTWIAASVKQCHAKSSTEEVD